MGTTVPPLGWAGTIGLTAMVALLILGIVVYHVWLDRRLRRERQAQDPERAVAPPRAAVRSTAADRRRPHGD